MFHFYFLLCPSSSLSFLHPHRCMADKGMSWMWLTACLSPWLHMGPTVSWSDNSCEPTMAMKTFCFAWGVKPACSLPVRSKVLAPGHQSSDKAFTCLSIISKSDLMSKLQELKSLHTLHQVWQSQTTHRFSKREGYNSTSACKQYKAMHLFCFMVCRQQWQQSLCG